MTFDEVLEEFKQSESADMIVPLVEDADLRNGVAAWRSVIIKRKEGELSDSGLSEAERWETLWTLVEFNEINFAVVSGVPKQSVHSLFMRLKGLRLIYPDGTVNDFASKYLQSLIIAKLPKGKK